MAIIDYPDYPKSLGPYEHETSASRWDNPEPANPTPGWYDIKKPKDPTETLPVINTIPPDQRSENWREKFIRVDTPRYDGFTDFYVSGLALTGVDIVRFRRSDTTSPDFAHLFPRYDGGTGEITGGAFFVRLAPLKLQKATYP